MRLEDRCEPFARMVQGAQLEGFYPFFRPIDRSWGPEVECGGKRLVMIGSNDYLGFSHDSRVMDASHEALRRWGTGPGGSRFLSGNTTLIEALEERLSAFVGKKKAVVHSTGFSANLGAIGCLLEASDVLLCDKENHASIFEGCRSSPARVYTFLHNNADSARSKQDAIRQKYPDSDRMLVTEGVFSMSGDFVDLPGLAGLKRDDPNLMIYLDDAHGLGVMGPGGHGTAAHYGLGGQMDFIMGTFSKALASIGGFIAADREDVLVHLKHHSKTLMFSAALPAGNVAVVLACLDLLEKEPERVERLMDVTRRVRDGYREIGLYTGHTETPIIPIYIGSEDKAYRFASELFELGVFALPAAYPAVPRGQAVIRTAYMSTHEQRHLDFVMEQIGRLAAKHHIRMRDFSGQEPFLRKAGCLSETLVT